MSIREKVTPALIILCFICAACTGRPEAEAKAQAKRYRTTQEQLQRLLQHEESTDIRYAEINQIAGNMLAMQDYNALVLFLTSWVENHPDDQYNAYWLLMVADSYLKTDAERVAEYYFERIIRNFPDVMVKGQSVHFLCLQHLIQISSTPAHRISYFNQLISQFPDDANITEMYYRLALEYEEEGEWEQALKAFTLFLNREDATTIQIAGIPNAYLSARQLVDFSKSSKDWTFESLDALVAAIKRSISNYDYRALERYRSKVNFFAISWQGDKNDENAPLNTTMNSYMRGSKIFYAETLDSSSTPTEAYLRTWGWNSYVKVWYLYFRKINFPIDPDIHGQWEWAGIYYDEKL